MTGGGSAASDSTHASLNPPMSLRTCGCVVSETSSGREAHAEQHVLGADDVGHDGLHVPAGQARRTLSSRPRRGRRGARRGGPRRRAGRRRRVPWAGGWASVRSSCVVTVVTVAAAAVTASGSGRSASRVPSGTAGTSRRSAPGRRAPWAAGSRRGAGSAATTARRPTGPAPRRPSAGRRRPGRTGTGRRGRTASGRRSRRRATTRSWSARTSSCVDGSAIASATTPGSMPISASSSSATSGRCGWRPSSCSARPARSYQTSTSAGSLRRSRAAIRSIDQP